MIIFPEAFEMHVADYINNMVNWLLITFSSFFEGVSHSILGMLNSIGTVMFAIPWWAYLLIVFALAWFTTKKLGRSIGLAALPIFIGMFGLWARALDTFSIIFTAVIISVFLGIPLGVLMAESETAEKIIRPLLDTMQTMPSFVYLIPAVMIFSLGKVSAVLATIIYSIPPIVRLTHLGLNQVSAEIEEAALAYGTTRWQLLKEVRLPLAVPSILTGVNQTTMMALAMVVIASMIGGGGLGDEVLRAINRIDVGLGFEAGISVVILAIIVDRLTQGLAKRWEPPQDVSA